MKEIFVDIVGFEGKYQISNFGRVKSIGRIIGNGNGYFKPESIITLQKDTDGYLQFSLPIEKRKSITHKVHRMVAKHFIQFDISPKSHVCHIDSDKNNNRRDNLYIGDVITNTVDRYNAGSTKLTIDQIKEIRSAKGFHKDIAVMYNIKQSYVSRIKNRSRAGHIQ